MHLVHTYTSDDGQSYDVDKLIARLKNRPTKQFLIKDLKGINRSRKNGFSPVSRLPYADTKWPVIVDIDNNLVDGRHRAIKLIDAGETKIIARLATPQDMRAVKLES